MLLIIIFAVGMATDPNHSSTRSLLDYKQQPSQQKQHKGTNEKEAEINYELKVGTFNLNKNYDIH